MVERFRGFLTLAAVDPDPGDPHTDREQLITRYMLGFGRRPIPPPCSGTCTRSTKPSCRR